MQAQILDLIADLQREFDSAVILITHDLGVVAEIADDVLVMYAGRGVEYGTGEQVFRAPQHPYTWGLLASCPRSTGDRRRAGADPGQPAEPARPAAGLPVPPAVPLPRARPAAVPRPSVPSCATSAPGHRVACHLDDAQRRRILDEEVAAWL